MVYIVLKFSLIHWQKKRPTGQYLSESAAANEKGK